jgi:hypothetical protein
MALKIYPFIELSHSSKPVLIEDFRPAMFEYGRAFFQYSVKIMHT